MDADSPYRFQGRKLTEVAFPLGGIGTGCLSLEGRGAIRDWEIFGRPNKNTVAPNTFPSLWCQKADGTMDARVVQGPRLKDFLGIGSDYGSGNLHQGEGLPCFAKVEFVGKFPGAEWRFHQPGHPLSVRLEAYSPFIPLDDRSSSMPVAALTYEITNLTGEAVSLLLAWNVMNPVGMSDPAADRSLDQAFAEPLSEGDLTGLQFRNSRYASDDPHGGTFALTTSWPDVARCPRWTDTGWFDGLQDFWSKFRIGELNDAAPNLSGSRVTASLGLRAKLEPGPSVRLPFLFSWVFPNADRYWDRKAEPDTGTWKRYYATQWPDAWSAATEYFRREDELRHGSYAFQDALFASDLPTPVIASIAYTTSILRTPTVDRLEDGTLWAWEGCNPNSGCCHGSCSHVWNYALTHAYLFPKLYQTMLESAFEHGFNCGPEGVRGAMNFRLMIPLAAPTNLWHAAIDGQLGLVIQLYRTWKRSGDDRLLERRWPAVKAAIQYAWVQWDRDHDGLVDGDMHNTYDINFLGPNPLGQFFYLGALKAGEELARHQGDAAFADRLSELFESGQRLTEERLWNGSYFVQRGTPDAKYQHGEGCLSDQVFGSLCARLAGLGDLVDPPLIESALAEIMARNFRKPIGDHVNLQRSYAAGDESGLVLCTWEEGKRPAYPFVYSDEVWTGIEYQVATHLASFGRTEEALEIVKAVRSRYDGERRNPYNEVECGSHYARALASYGLLLTWPRGRSAEVVGSSRSPVSSTVPVLRLP